MTTLWSRTGSTGKPVLIANTDKTAIVECTVCPCYEMSVVISCPEYLHLLGGPKTLTITVTYSKPPLSSPPLPAVYITEKDSFPAMVCNTCMVVDENQTNAWLDFTEGGGQWSGAPGDDTRTWSHSVLAVGLPTNAGTDNTGFVVVEAFHPTKVDENDEPVSVTETPCEIELSNVVHCSVNMPEDVCTEDKFTITIEATDRDGEPLIRMDGTDHEELFVGTPHRFGVSFTGDYTIADGMPPVTAWVEGVWTCEDVSIDSDEGTLEVDLLDWHVSVCEATATAAPCTITVTFTTVPEVLHTLGDAKDFLVEVVYDYPSGTPKPHPIFEITYSDWMAVEGTTVIVDNDYLTDDGTDTPVDLSASGQWAGTDNRTWSGKIRIDRIAHPDREHNVIIVARHPSLLDGQGNHLILNSAAIWVTDLVTCTATAEGIQCAWTPFKIVIEATAEYNGEALTRMDSDYGEWGPHSPPLFGEDYRFAVRLEGSYELPEDFSSEDSWVKGVWTCDGIYSNISQETVITAGLVEWPRSIPAPDPLCAEDFTVEVCSIDVSISCPGNLHTLGDAKDLTITVTFEHGEQADYLPSIQVLDEEGNPTSVLLDDDTDQPVAWEAAVNWVAQGEDLKVWKLDVQVRIDSMPGDAGTETVTVQAFHPFQKDSLGEPEPLGSPCSISLSEEVTCSISGLSESICVDSEDADDPRRKFSLNIQAVGSGDETLTRMTYATYPGLFGRYGRFNVIISGASSPECLNADEPWTSGNWDCSGLIASVGSVWVAVEDNDIISCEESIVVDYCPDEGDPIPEPPEPLRNPHLSPTDVPQLLHIHGQAYNLGFRISNFDTPIDIRRWNISAEWTLDGVVQGCPLVTSNNSSISLSGSRWDINGVWEEAVMAPSSISFSDGLYARVGLTVTATGVVNVGDAPIVLTTSVSIGVTKAYAVNITATDTVRPGESFLLGFIVRGPDFQDLIRVPESGPIGLQIEILDEDGEPADAYDEEHNPFTVFWQGEVSGGMIYFSTIGTKYINARGDDAAGTLFEQATVTVSDEPLDLARLARAINERTALWGYLPIEPEPDGSWDPWTVYDGWGGYPQKYLRKAPKADGTEGSKGVLVPPPATPPAGSSGEVWAQYDSDVLAWAGAGYREIAQVRWSSNAEYSKNAAMSARMGCSVGIIKQLSHTGERRCVGSCGTPDALYSNEYPSETKEGLWSRAVGAYVSQWAAGTPSSDDSYLVCSRGGYLSAGGWGDADISDEIGSWDARAVHGESTVRSWDISCTRSGDLSWTCYVWLVGISQEGGATVPGVPALPEGTSRRVWAVAGSGSAVKTTPKLFPAMPPPPPCPSTPSLGPYGDVLVNPAYGASIGIHTVLVRHNFSA